MKADATVGQAIGGIEGIRRPGAETEDSGNAAIEELGRTRRCAVPALGVDISQAISIDHLAGIGAGWACSGGIEAEQVGGAKDLCLEVPGFTVPSCAADGELVGSGSAAVFEKDQTDQI